MIIKPLINYRQSIIDRLKDSDNWPIYKRPDFLSKLDEVADDAFILASERDCIASVLIYQQLIEELLKTLLQSANFLMQAHLLPFEICVNENKNQMFGRLIEDFKTTISVPNRNELIDIANRVNQKRIEIAHGLTKKESLSDLLEIALSVRNDFEKFFPLYDESYDWTRVCLSGLKKDIIEE